MTEEGSTKEWAILQTRVEAPREAPPCWNKPFPCEVREDEDNLCDHTTSAGYIYRTHVVRRGFPTEEAAIGWLREVGIL
jgi:hypothetical protein